ncbi:hypothetical protein, partial [Shewanella baltica]|uniref:hypothetical protein n=1 Tax=Shewanella baltica TaxID=62322 RepID=UPI00217DCF21
SAASDVYKRQAHQLTSSPAHQLTSSPAHQLTSSLAISITEFLFDLRLPHFVLVIVLLLNPAYN